MANLRGEQKKKGTVSALNGRKRALLTRLTDLNMINGFVALLSSDPRGFRRFRSRGA